MPSYHPAPVGKKSAGIKKRRINPETAQFVRMIDGNIREDGFFVLTKPFPGRTPLCNRILIFS
jgi:hypothetical protein